MKRIELASINNIRDLGGTVTTSGQTIRPLCMIRSARLSSATDRDLKRLKKQYRVSTVIDLRSSQECLEKPDRTGSFTYIHNPIIEELTVGITHEEEADNSPMVPNMPLLYRGMMSDPTAIEGYRRVLNRIFTHDFDTGSVLWHCTAGKDRCGMVTAFILMTLGVDRDVIMEDYLETNRVNEPEARAVAKEIRKQYGEKAAEKVYAAIIADRSYLEAAFEVMGDDYLHDVLKLDENVMQKFRERVLE